MHWPFAVEMSMLFFSCAALNIILVIADLIVNLKRQKKTYGFQYFLILLPLIVNPAFIYPRNKLPEKRIVKLVQLDEHLMMSAYHRQIDNEGSINNIKKFSPGSADHLDSIHAHTMRALNFIYKLRSELISVNGGIIEKDYKYIGAEEINKINSIMIDNRKAFDLKEQLNNYAQYLRSQNVIEIADIAFNAKEHPLYLKHTKHRNKNFAELHFKDVTLVEALNTLSYYALEIISAEQHYLFGYLLKDKTRN